MSDGLTRQWAIRLPNGELYGVAEQRCNQAQAVAQYHSTSSVIRDAFGIPEPVQTPIKPYVFDTRAEAEYVFNKIVENVVAWGVTFWGGVIVERVCSPFTNGSAIVEFGDQVQAWLDEQEGSK
jgi:hypothetical protein